MGDLRLPEMGDVRAAAARLKGHTVTTPLLNSPTVDARLGGRLLIKAESLQRTGSFKFRGACNALAQLGRPSAAPASSPIPRAIMPRASPPRLSFSA